MKAGTAEIYITKLAAAERQLNAAIRMVLANEDELAIHTVAAAAYRILRDVKQHRGRSELSEFFAAAVHGLANDLVSGKLKSVPAEIADFEPLALSIEIVANAMRSGKNITIADAARTIRTSNEIKHWREFNAPANFLKHADNDIFDTKRTSEFKFEKILFPTIMSYVSIFGRSTPEIEAFAVLTMGGQDGFETPFWSGEHNQKFAQLTPAKRRAFCLKFLKILKKHGLRREYENLGW